MFRISATLHKPLVRGNTEFKLALSPFPTAIEYPLCFLFDIRLLRCAAADHGVGFKVCKFTASAPAFAAASIRANAQRSSRTVMVHPASALTNVVGIHSFGSLT